MLLGGYTFIEVFICYFGHSPKLGPAYAMLIGYAIIQGVAATSVPTPAQHSYGTATGSLVLGPTVLFYHKSSIKK